MHTWTLLTTLLALAGLALAIPVAEPAHAPLESRQSTSLHAAFVRRGKRYFGNIADPGTLASPQTQTILRNSFGQITPENSMKWDATEPNRGQFTFGAADQTASFAAANGKLLRCHALVWHNQLPGWVQGIRDRGTLQSAMERHIAAVVGRYRGRCFAWDVVNEIFEENGSLRRSVFSKVLGEDFVRIAFASARRADPGAKLYINDYNLDNANYAKTQGLANKVRQWRAQGVPIDGIGSQSHLGAGGAGGTQGALTLLASTGVPEVAITELDIAGAAPNDYTTVMQACLNVPKCIGITEWGVTDDQSWRRGQAATVFYGNFTPKPAYTALLRLLGA